MIPDTELLQVDRYSPVWVRVTAIERVWILGFRLEGKANRLGQEMFERSAGTVGAWPVSQPTVNGGAVVIDFRMARTTTARDFRRRLAQEFSLRIEDITLDRLTQSDLSRESAPPSRREAAEEAEQEAAATRLSLSRIAGGVSSAARGVRTVLILAVAAAGLLVVPGLLRDLRKATGSK